MVTHTKHMDPELLKQGSSKVRYLVADETGTIQNNAEALADARKQREWLRNHRDGRTLHIVRETREYVPDATDAASADPEGDNNRPPVSFQIHEPREPGEATLLEATPELEIEHSGGDPRAWRYVFKVKDFTETLPGDHGGVTAILTSIYTPEDGVPEVDVNVGTRVPKFIRDEILDELEIDEFGRPPFIPKRDGEPTEPRPVPRIPDDTDGPGSMTEGEPGGGGDGWDVVSVDPGPGVKYDGEWCERCEAEQVSGESTHIVEFKNGVVKEVCSACAGKLEESDE